jgi:hypothetical protein
MTDKDVQHLQAAAKDATGGTWWNTVSKVKVDGPLWDITIADGMSHANAKYLVAAQPANILHLISDLAARDAEIARLKKALAVVKADWERTGEWDDWQDRKHLPGTDWEAAELVEAALSQPASAPAAQINTVPTDNRFHPDTVSWPRAESSSPAAQGEDCGNCHKCLEGKAICYGPYEIAEALTRMIVCPVCGNKRCPKATDHHLDCTGSNEQGQPGSVYAAAPLPQGKEGE